MSSRGTLPPVAVVTGATRGLGKAVVERLVPEGYRVVTCSTTAAAPGVGESLHRAADLADPKAAEGLLREVVDRFQRVDVLVNNAGYANRPAPLPETSDAIAQRCFATNVLGPYSLMRLVIPVMASQDRGGVIVNIASRAAIVPVPLLAAYSASKSALVSLTLAVSKEIHDPRVVCVSVCPGGMDTEMREALYGSTDARGQQDPRRVAGVVVEVATRRSLRGQPVPSGAAILVAKDEEPSLLEWPRDVRGHRRFTFG
jgi:NAD(P)-dependent dehydrogenase (short-subunit alcohol dehydrogenase family)